MVDFIIKKDFKYWDRSHYAFEEVSGSLDACIQKFQNICKKYPSKKFSTHVTERVPIAEDTYCFKIKRFKTEELFRIHAEYPPTYVRKGKVL